MSRSGISPQDLQPGDHLGRFEIQAKIGRGGYGYVFRALDPTINSTVAIKVLTANDDANSVKRFINEAAAARKLVHPNIVTVFEFGQEGSTPYLVMEYLDGEDLQHIIESHRTLSLYQKIRIMVQVADGLHCAHRNGVLHRDVKPANIMVLRDYAVKIMDFGIARLMRDTSTRLTQQGSLVGTVVYMAPELFSDPGVEVDALCDVWSYGVILYELLAGKNPFQTGVMQSEIYRIVTLKLPPINAEACPPELQEVVDRLLNRQREQRYQTLEDARFALQPILKGLEVVEVDRILSAARQFLDLERYTEALDAAREALRLDSSHRLARNIFDLAQKQLQDEAQKRAIDNVVNRAKELVKSRAVSDAIEYLETCPSPVRNDLRIRGLVQELQTLKRNGEEAAKLVDQAERAYAGQRLAEARELLAKALDLDPENKKALQLKDRIQDEIQRQEEDRAYTAEIRKVDRHVTFGELEPAEVLLAEIDSKYPGRSLTVDRWNKLKERIDERRRWQELARLKARAKELVLNQEFTTAIRELEKLRTTFSDDEEVRELLDLATKEQEERQRGEDIQRISDAAMEHTGSQRFDAAIDLLMQGLQKYADDPALLRLLRFVRDAQRSFQRERDLQSALQQGHALYLNERHQELLDFFGGLAPDIQSNRELRDLVSEARKKRDLAERSQQIRTARDQGGKLLGEKKFDDATRVVEAAISQVGTDRDLQDLLHRINDAKVLESERQRIDTVIRDAKWLETRGDISRSLKIIEDELVHFTNSHELKAERDRLRAKDQERTRISALETAIRNALTRKAWTEAEERLKEAIGLFPSEGSFRSLADELQRLRSEQVDQLVREGRRLLDGGFIPDAEQFLVANLVDFRDDPEVQALARDVGIAKRKKTQVAACLREAQDREGNNDLAGAFDILQKGLQQYRDDEVLKRARQRVSDLIAANRQRELVTEIEQELSRSDWERAQPLLDQARTDYPNDPAFIPLERRANNLRRAFLEGAAEAIREDIKAKCLDDARKLFQRTLAPHPEENITREVGAEIQAAEAVSALERDKRAGIADSLRQVAIAEQEGDYSKARTILQKALKKYPDDAELEAALARVEAGDRKRALAAKTAVIKKDLDRSSWQDALKHLEEARPAFPENPAELDALELQARDLRKRELQRWLEQAQTNLKQGNFAEVDKLLNKQLVPFANEPAVVALKDQKVRAILIQTATTNTTAKSYDKAEAAIDELANVCPGDAEVSRLRSALAAAREQDRKERLYREGRADANRLMKSRKYAEAIPRLESLLALFPGDRQLLEDLASAKHPKEPVAAKPLTRWLAIGGGAVVLAGLLWFVVPRTPDLKVVPDNLSFQLQPGSPIAPQTVTVTGPSSFADPQAGESWVSFTREKFNNGATEFTIRVAPESLSPGSHATELRFPNQKTVRVAVNVAAKPSLPPTFDVSPKHLTFPYSPAGMTAQSLTATGTEIPVPHPSEGWLTVDAGKRSPGKVEYQVRVLPNGLVAGKMNTAVLEFSPEMRVPVDVTVPAPEAFEVSARRLTFAYSRGGMSAQMVAVTGAGNLPTPHPDMGWLTASVTKRAPGRVEYAVRVSPNELVAGKLNTAHLNFSGDVSVAVEVNVPAADISVQPRALAFPQGGSRQTVTVNAPGYVQEPGHPTWIAIRRIPNTPSGTTQFSVETSTLGLEPGKTQQFELIFSPQARVHVELAVPPGKGPAPPLALSTSALSFTWDRSKTPGTQTVIASGPADIQDPKRNNNAPWLTVTPGARGANRVDYSVSVSTDVSPGSHSEDLLFQDGKKVHVEYEVFDQPEPNPPLHRSIEWSGEPSKAGDVLVIKGRSVTPKGMILKQTLPTYNGLVAVDNENVSVAQQPSSTNNYKLILRIKADGVKSISLEWTRQ